MKRVPAEGLVGLVQLREAASTELNQVMQLVRAAVQARFDAAKKPGESYAWFDIEAMFADRVIVCKDGRYWQYPYSIDATNTVQLGDPAEVVEEFRPVTAAAASSSGKAPSSSGAEEPTTTGAPSSELSAGVSKLAEGDDAVFLEAVGGDGAAYEAVLVRSGLAKNSAKTYYTDAALREAAPRFDGARVFALPDVKHLGDPALKRDVNQVAGWISNTRFVEGASPDSGYVGGRLNLLPGDLRNKITDAWGRGKRDLVALSIDAAGKARKADAALAARGAKRVVDSITKVHSVDLIVEPSAGGALVRLAEAADTSQGGQDPMKEKMLAAIKAKFPSLDVATLNDDQVLARYTEAMAPAPAAAAAATDTAAGEVMTRKDFEAYQRLVEARGAAATKINATTLPAPVKAELVVRFNRLERFTEADVDTEIKAERERVVRLAESMGLDAGKVKLAVGDVQVEDRSLRIARMLDAFFNPGGKDAEGKIYDRVHSFKECYIEITGDKRVSGRIENCDRARLAESVGAAFRESVDTAAFSNVLGSSLTRRMVQDYNNVTEYDGYRQIVGTPVPLNDFRTQERVRFGGYGDLATVAQGSAYPALASPTDEKATYAPAKRGGTEDVTLEAIKNDDVGAIRRIPLKMGRAAKRTLAKFVFDFIRTNPTIYDSVAFFHASHGNLGSTAFSAAEYGVVRIAMGKQTELNSADRLGIYPAIILYPLDLQEPVWNAFQRNTNLDKTFVQQLNPTLVPVWYWTDTNDWAALANPNDLQTIELGFLDGQEEPALFVQDMPNVGSMFSNDKLTYKIRHIYGGNVVDYRGAYKEVV